MRSQLSALLLGAFPLVGIAIVPTVGREPYVKSAFVTVTNDRTIPAEPEKVWQTLITAEGFGTLLGVTVKTPTARLEHVGDHVAATWVGREGSLVTTRVVSSKELRTIWDAEDGSSVCQHTVRLMAAPGGTKVWVTERYSDDQADRVDKAAEDQATVLSNSIVEFDGRVRARR